MVSRNTSTARLLVLKKIAGRLTDKTDGRVWFGNFVVSKIAQK